jgi:arylsulfatase A-like enzyme
MRVMKPVLILIFLSYTFSSFSFLSAEQNRPNILWLVVEDQSKHYGFNGENLVHTPVLDGLAANGVRFTNASVTAPVCSTARSALITGMFQTSIGAHHHRSGRGKVKIQKPDHIKLIPELFKDAGYYTCLGSSGQAAGTASQKHKNRLGKSDYNFEWDPSVFDSAEWSGRKKEQPFFAKICLSGGKARSQARGSKDIPHVDASKVVLPPYYPRHPVVLEDWAAYLDTFSLMDFQVGQIIDRLKKEGEFENTIIFFITDHGVSHARGKQFCYDEGMMIPFFVHAPNRVQAGTVRKEPVLHIDLAATSLYFAGIELPKYMEARTLFGPKAIKREFAVSARDRCDETYDRIRAVRTLRYKYIRNGYPQRPHLQPCAYKDNKDIYIAIRDWGEKGKLSDLQQNLLLSPKRAKEELYDLKNDPWELNNLADDPSHAKALQKMRKALNEWIRETNDNGQNVESMKMYDSDMQLYLDGLAKRGRGDRLEEIKANIALMKKWWKEGK